jgi:cytidyltransferase-like protein
MEKTAVYPGSFDPITHGHIDIINRGLRVFDRIIILVSYNPAKKSLFTADERVSMIREVIGSNDRLSVDDDSGLIVEYVRKAGACAILRGLRAMSDFEYSSRWPSLKPASRPGNRNHLSHDRLEVVLLQFQHRQGSGQFRGGRPRSRSRFDPAEN